MQPSSNLLPPINRSNRNHQLGMIRNVGTLPTQNIAQYRNTSKFNLTNQMNNVYNKMNINRQTIIANMRKSRQQNEARRPTLAVSRNGNSGGNQRQSRQSSTAIRNKSKRNPIAANQVSPSQSPTALIQPSSQPFIIHFDAEHGIKNLFKHPRLTKQEIALLPVSTHSGSEIQCAICLDKIVIGDQVIYLVCFHFYHAQCCRKWMYKSIQCPICKVDVSKHLRHSKS